MVGLRRPAALVRRRAAGIPHAGVELLHAASRRALVIRAALATSLLVLLVLAVLFARALDSGGQGLVPRGTSGVVVIDLSRSVSGGNVFRRIRIVLERLVASDAPIGVVAFSDGAYELMPPGSPARALRPLLRYFTPRATSAGRQFPDNPWESTFRFGTRISYSLELAKEMLERDQVRNGSILLVSDLDTAADDLPRLRRTLAELRAASIPLRAVPLTAQNRATRLYSERLYGRDVIVDEAALGGGDGGIEIARAAVPVSLVVVAGLLIVLLAPHEWLCARLTVTAAKGRQESRA
jgi:hypothetical protein